MLRLFGYSNRRRHGRTAGYARQNALLLHQSMGIFHGFFIAYLFGLIDHFKIKVMRYETSTDALYLVRRMLRLQSF